MLTDVTRNMSAARIAEILTMGAIEVADTTPELTKLIYQLHQIIVTVAVGQSAVDYMTEEESKFLYEVAANLE